MASDRLSGWRRILSIAWPLILANSFWNLQLTIDRIFLGQYSTDALGAAIAVGGVFWTPMALLQQTSAYSTTFVAQYFGAKQLSRIGPSVWQAIHLSLVGGLLFLVFVPLSGPIFQMIGHSEKMLPLEIDYFRALCFSALPTALVAAASGFFTGLGDTKMVMKINAVGLVANAFLDYLLIFGRWGFPAMGIVGAGYATALATLISALYGIYHVYRSDDGRYGMRGGWRFDGELLGRFLKFGIPSGMQWALEGLAFTVFLVILGRMPNGDAALSSSGIVVTVMMLAVLPALGIAQAVTVLVGQHLGEKRPHEAEKDTWSGVQVAAIYIITVGLSFLLFPQFYLSWFHNAENAALWSEVSVMVPYLLMFVALFTAFDSINLVISFALKGAGDTRFVTLVALTLPWPIMIFPTWLMTKNVGAVYWAWGAASLYVIIQASIFIWRFLGGKWKSMSVIR